MISSSPSIRTAGSKTVPHQSERAVRAAWRPIERHQPQFRALRERAQAQVPAPAQQPLFLSPQDVAAIVAERSLAVVLAELKAAIAADFSRWSAFDKSARVAHHSEAGVIELMPTQDGSRYAFKYVNGHPGNGAQGLPTVMAFGVLANVATGAPLLVSELTLTTALRTAATSALAADLLLPLAGRAEAHRRMALIGCGAQAYFQAAAFAAVMGVREFALFDVDAPAAERLAGQLRANGWAAQVFESVDAAVLSGGHGHCGIVTTATADKRRATVLGAHLLRPGMHINAIGGDCPGKTELAPELLQAATRVAVEFAPQTRIEGDVQQMPADFPVIEIWELMARPPQRNASDTTVFDSVGFALEDFSALNYLHQAAQAQGLGQRLPLMPAGPNPKDLAGGLGLV